MCVVADGLIIYRNGTTKETPSGTSWSIITTPGSDVGIRQLAMGSENIWLLNNQGSVYYIKCNKIGHNCERAWVEVPGEMKCISVTERDQVRSGRRFKFLLVR